jgi:hypothetical protein
LPSSSIPTSPSTATRRLPLRPPPAGVIRRHNLQYVVISAPAASFTAEDLAGLTQAAAAGLAVTNNLYSSDLVAFPVRGHALEVIETLGRDNALARALHEQAAIHVEELPRILATQFDIDAPTDIAAFSLVDAESSDLPGGRKEAPLALGPRLR